MVRVAHFSPDAPAVDVYVNDDRVLAGVAYTVAAVGALADITAGRRHRRGRQGRPPAPDRRRHRHRPLAGRWHRHRRRRDRITCGDQFDRSSGHYLDNFVVSARLAEG